MSVKPSRRKCLCCKRIFCADRRNDYHQRYCSNPRCRKASKKASQRRWRRKPQNRDYDCGAHRAEQVRAWREAHPGYWKSKSKPISGVQPVGSQIVSPCQKSRNGEISGVVALRDVCFEQSPAFVGLLSMVTGSTLRDDIAATTRQLLLKGENILGLKTPEATCET